MARAALPRTNAALFARACEAIPGGVNSSIRAFKAVGGTPYMVQSAEGCHVIDIEGRRYVDLVQSYGAIILGHAHPVVTEAIARAAAGGTSYGAPTPGEVLLAEAIVDRVPSCERVRLMNSGTEATSTAVRLARGFTGRDRVVIFHGNFHGATDALLAAGGSGVATLGLPGTAGVPAAAVANTMVVPYNVVPELDEQVAAVIVEPVAANMGVVAPVPGFLEGLRAECDRVGALLVFDEVITGFRLAPGGAQQRFGVTPDIATFAKAIANGFPVAAIAGRADLLDLFGKGVVHGGTFNAQPVAMAATLATLDALTPELFATIELRGRRLMDGIRDELAAAGHKAVVTGWPQVFHVAFDLDAPARNWRDLARMNRAKYIRFCAALLANGVRALERGAWFMSAAHDDAIVDETLEAVRRAAREVPVA